LQEFLITRSVNDAGNRNFGLLRVPSNTNIFLLSSWEGEMENIRRFSVKDIYFWLEVVTFGLTGLIVEEVSEAFPSAEWEATASPWRTTTTAAAKSMASTASTEWTMAVTMFTSGTTTSATAFRRTFAWRGGGLTFFGIWRAVLFVIGWYNCTLFVV
jgi:hypothetical protein